MPNVFNAQGFQIETWQETFDRIADRMRAIYGTGINLASNTPDGQFVAILTQDVQDLLELMQRVNASFDPDEATGVILNQRVAINGIERRNESYSITPVTITVGLSSVNLYGIDQSVEPPFTISDAADTRWVLASTVLGLPLGIHQLTFRALEPGVIIPTPNTLTNLVTKVQGVASNNPLPYSYLGAAEESDGALKIRRRQAVSIGGRQWTAALNAALSNLTGMISARVYENYTDTVDYDGVPAHGIWVVLEGSASNTEIANTIYNYKTGGCDMRGDTTLTVSRPGASPTAIRWDVAVSQNLFIFMNPVWIEPSTELVDYSQIAAYLVQNSQYIIGQSADFTSIGATMQDLDPNLAMGPAPGTYPMLYDVGVYSGATQIFSTSQSGIDSEPTTGQYTVGYLGNVSAAIDWDDSETEVQDKLRAVPGLSTVNVSLSLPGAAVYRLLVDFESRQGAGGLLTIESNTLENTLGGELPLYPQLGNLALEIVEPWSVVSRFVLRPENIIFPLRMLPNDELGTLVAVSGTTISFTAQGGYGSRTFLMLENPSGGGIAPSSGVYTAGATTGVTDRVYVQDELSFRSQYISISVI